MKILDNNRLRIGLHNSVRVHRLSFICAFFFSVFDFRDALGSFLQASPSEWHNISFEVKRGMEDSGFSLPPLASIAKYRCCDKAVHLLRRFQPSVLNGWTPVHVDGDGNCMFRSVSLAMYGTAELHKELRCLACVEIADNKDIYDSDSSNRFCAATTL